MSVTGKNEIKNRNASPSAYGWAFQVGAGIKLMLENITEFTALKMEGKNDDIELSLPSGKIYAQAKSVTVMGDQSSATEKLKKALETLSDDATKDNNSIKLIYITNASELMEMARIQIDSTISQKIANQKGEASDFRCPAFCLYVLKI